MQGVLNRQAEFSVTLGKSALFQKICVNKAKASID